MKALILAGGFGTRLRPLSCTRPKTLFPVVNKPLLQWTFERLAKSKIKEVILGVNAQTSFYIKKSKFPKYGLRIKYSIDPPKMPLGTAGPIKKAEKLLGHESSFLVLNGDIFSDLDYENLLEQHFRKGAVATIALYEVGDPSRYGVVELGKDGAVKQFIEKPTKEAAPTNLINAGIYVLDPKIFDFIPKDKAISMERDVFPRLAEKNELQAQVIRGLWMDIGKPDEYLLANRTLLLSMPNMKLASGADLFKLRSPVALDKDVSLGEKSSIGPYVIIGKNAQIGKNVKITESLVLSDVTIGSGSLINGAIIGEGAVIGKNVTLRKGCIIGDQAKIRDNVSLSAKTSVCPAKEVSENILNSKVIC